MRLIPLLVLFAALSALSALADLDVLPDDQTVQLIRQQHGNAAAGRVERWQGLMRQLYGLNEEDKVRTANQFFNRIPSVTDQAHWGQRDYWATPLEMLASNGGDCEDFALAKYFTLRAAGVPNERLRITYVRARLERERREESHMVLAYYPFADSDPLILDNLVREVKPATERDDLTPTLGFNAEGLWSAKQRGQHGRIGEVSKIDHWNSLLARMRRER